MAGFAAEVMTLDCLGRETWLVRDLRPKKLVYLLAISLIHKVLLVSVIVLAVRTMCLFELIYISRPYAKKIAAFVVLSMAAVYLGLVGGRISTKSACAKEAVMLLAVFLKTCNKYTFGCACGSNIIRITLRSPL